MPLRRLPFILLLPLLASCVADGSSTGGESERGAPETGADVAPEASTADAGPDADADTDPGADAGADTGVEAAPPDASAPLLRLMTYNIKHGGLSSMEAIADVIKAEKADIVGLQEVDVNAARSGNVDQPDRLGQLTGMASVFRSALTLSGGGLYGLAVLSRFPIKTSQKISLTSKGEQRILFVVDIDVNGKTVPFGVTHLGTTASDRTTQAAEVLSAVETKPLAVLVGDMNATPGEATMKSMAAKLTDTWLGVGVGDGFTIPADTPTKRIDYVYVGSSWPAAVEAHVPATVASDHRPVVVTIASP